MNLLLALQIGLREIGAHKFRSVLSMLGIVLGVSSLISTLALTTGIERGTRAFMEQIGGLEFVNVVDKEASNKMADFWNLSPGRTLKDADAIRGMAPLVSYVSPELHFYANVSSESGRSERYKVRGVFPDYFVVAKHGLRAGRFLSDLDIERAARCAVIGSTIAKMFWPDLMPEEIVGRFIRINDNPFQVVGVLPVYERDVDKLRKKNARSYATRQSGRWDPFRAKNEIVLIPFSTMFYEFRSGTSPQDSMESIHLDILTLQIGDLEQFQPALNQVRAALEVTHRGVDDFDLETREEWFDRMEASVRAARLSGGLIAAISLVVGGIGIMNIMLASISERVREIGICLAVGARSSDIFVQILTESVTIAFLGGLLGVMASFGLNELLKSLAPTENMPIITIGAVLFSVLFAILAGFLSGIYPALKASQLNPIAALRYE